MIAVYIIKRKTVEICIYSTSIIISERYCKTPTEEDPNALSKLHFYRLSHIKDPYLK